MFVLFNPNIIPFSISIHFGNKKHLSFLSSALFKGINEMATLKCF